jgi:carboxylate-amine ligase
VPPALWDFDAYAEQLAWGTRAGVLPSPRHWWWELRLHPSFGTVEVRVADAQTTVAETVAIAGLVHALVAWLDGRAAAGETLAVAPRWRIEENRWSACRWGLAGELADLETGEREPTARALARLIAELRPAAERIGAASSLDAAHELLRRGGGAVAQRRVAAERGLAGLAGWLAERYDAD